ncbi:MAG: hypothetical protein AB8B58_03235 [Roseobacter sp.]
MTYSTQNTRGAGQMRGWPAVRSLTRCSVPLALLVLTGCGATDFLLQDRQTGQIEIAPVLSCAEAREQDAGLIGVHLRQSDVAQSFELFSLAGRANRDRLPKNLDINQQKTRLVSETAEALQEGGTPATAQPRRAFRDGESLPAVYDLSYRLDGANFAGPLVVGNGAAGADIPTTGRTAYSGKVQLSRSVSNEDGSTAIATADARFTVVVGYGSNSATFLMSDLTTTSGEPMPFVSLEWRNLGLCGARVVSTGQGTVRLLSEDGRRISPFTDGRTLPVLLSSFEAMHFEGGNPPQPPGDFGGIFSIESDTGTLAAIFLTDVSP